MYMHYTSISLRLKYRIHSTYEKSMVERTIEYLKDRIECFDDYYPCMRTGICNLRHVYKWLILFVFMYNRITKSHIKFSNIKR
jgi:putative transposase